MHASAVFRLEYHETSRDLCSTKAWLCRFQYPSFPVFLDNCRPVQLRGTDLSPPIWNIYLPTFRVHFKNFKWTLFKGSCASQLSAGVNPGEVDRVLKRLVLGNQIWHPYAVTGTINASDDSKITLISDICFDSHSTATKLV